MKKCNQYHPDQAKQDLYDTELCISNGLMSWVFAPGCDVDDYDNACLFDECK